MIYKQTARLSLDGCILFHSNYVPSDAMLVLLGSLWLRTRHTHRAYNPLPWERACNRIKMKTPLESLCTLVDILSASLPVFLVHCWGFKLLPHQNHPALAERLHHQVCTQNHWKTKTLCSNKLLTTPKHLNTAPKTRKILEVLWGCEDSWHPRLPPVDEGVRKRSVEDPLVWSCPRLPETFRTRYSPTKLPSLGSEFIWSIHSNDNLALALVIPKNLILLWIGFCLGPTQQE